MIREYEEADADAVVATWRTSNELAHPFLSKAFLDKEADNVRNVYPKFAKIWVSEIDGKIVGFIAMIENEIGGLFLAPDCHGKGLGREMVDFVQAKCGALTVEVFRDNKIGRRFYDAYGFKKTVEYLHEHSGQMTLKMAFEPEGG